MSSEILCPIHGIKLNKKPILYGLPDPAFNFDDVILGGCLIDDDNPKYGYKCSVDKKVYYLGQDGMLKDK